MSARRVSRWALAFLLVALALAVVGFLLKRAGIAPFWTGMLLAFGEAALVGGLADWFAVRALFAHPFGLPFPHTALIPRNRLRLVAQIRNLVEQHWLSREMLAEKVDQFNFVGDGLIPMAGAHQDQLERILQDVARHFLDGLSTEKVATFLTQTTGRVLETDAVAPFLAEAIRRAHQEDWTEPFLRTGLDRLSEWSMSPACREAIHRHLQQATESYKDKGWFKTFTLEMAEALGGLDLELATQTLQHQLQTFAKEQMKPGSSLAKQAAQALRGVEEKLRTDPQYLEGIQTFLLQSSEEGTVHQLLHALVRSLHQHGLEVLDSGNSKAISWTVERGQAWLQALQHDEELQERINQACRRLAHKVLDRHHPLIGAIVEEQLNRLSDESLTQLIEEKVGEDLNWIRLNGTFVGGLIGIVLYCLFQVL